MKFVIRNKHINNTLHLGEAIDIYKFWEYIIIPLVGTFEKFPINLCWIYLETALANINMNKAVPYGYCVAYKPITLPCISLMFIEIKFIHCYSCVMFAMKSMSICNDHMNYDEIII